MRGGGLRKRKLAVDHHPDRPVAEQAPGFCQLRAVGAHLGRGNGDPAFCCFRTAGKAKGIDQMT